MKSVLISFFLSSFFAANLVATGQDPSKKFIIDFSKSLLENCNESVEFGKFKLTKLAARDDGYCEVEYETFKGVNHLGMWPGKLQVVTEIRSNRKYKTFEIHASDTCSESTITSYSKMGDQLEIVVIEEGATQPGILTKNLEDIGWFIIEQPCEGTLEKIVVLYQ